MANKIAGVVLCLAVMVSPFVVHMSDLVSLAVVLGGAWLGGMFSSMILAERYVSRALASPPQPTTAVKYVEGEPVSVTVSKTATTDQVLTVVRQKASSLNGEVRKRGGQMVIVVGNKIMPVALNYESARMVESNAPAPSAKFSY